MSENHACSDQASTPAGSGATHNAEMDAGVNGGAAQPGGADAAGGGSPQSEAMNAYDIPRYDSQGYVVGRPDTPNDPTSAGMVQGAPAEDAQQTAQGHRGPYQPPGPQTMAYGGMDPSYGQAQPGVNPMGQPGMQPPPQTMAYGGMDPSYGQAQPGVNPMGQPGMQPPPQGMAYGGMDPSYGQAQPGVNPMGQPGMQPPPQTMAYGGMDPSYGQAQPGVNPMGQPGMQPPPQGMAYGGMDPSYGQAQPGVNPMGQPGMQPPPQGMAYGGMDPSYGQAQPGYQQPQPEPAAQGSNAEQYGRIADVVKDISNGEQPDVNKLMEMFNTFDTAFWKGALIGVVVTLLVSNETVTGAIAGTMGGIAGAFKKDSAATPDTDAT